MGEASDAARRHALERLGREVAADRREWAARQVVVHDRITTEDMMVVAGDEDVAFTIGYETFYADDRGELRALVELLSAWLAR